MSKANRYFIFKNRPQAFFLAARPKTWSAGICPVCIGTTIAFSAGSFNLVTFLCTLLFSLFIQIGTNYANDYFDFVNHVDNSERIGPKRAVQQGWISPKAMLFATGAAFAVALTFAIPLIRITGIWSLPLALLCVLFGLLYTGGPKPLGYLGLGEVLVFLFFGPTAVMGSYFLQTGHLSFLAFLASIPSGLLCAAILLANNLRDEQTDRSARKQTIVVRFGARFGANLYAACFLISMSLSLFLTKIAFLALLPSLPLIRNVQDLILRRPDAEAWIRVLQRTSLLLLAYTLLFCWGIIW